MPHNWRWYYVAQKISQHLREAGLIVDKPESFNKVWGIIQIVLEEEK